MGYVRGDEMFSHILVPLDGSDLAECVLPHVNIMSDAMGARVTLFHSLERPHQTAGLYPVSPLDWHMLRAEARLYLDRIAEKLRETLSEVNCVLVEGSAAESVIEYAHGNDVDFMILSSHGRSGLSGWNISSVVQKIILRSYTSMLIVRAYGADNVTGYNRIMVALDCSSRAETAVSMGVMLAGAQNAELLLAHVLRAPEMPRRLPPSSEDIKLSEQLIERNQAVAEDYLRQLTAQLASENVVPATRLTVGRNVAATLENLVKNEEIELVILSAHGYEGDTNWPYGSVAVSFIASGSTPLLVMQDIPFRRAARTRAEKAAGENAGH